jgi:hypothetical protein
MSVVITKTTNRLAKLIKTPNGGITAARALSSARANLETIREDCGREIDELLTRMSATFAAGKGLEDAASLYSMSNLVIGFAGSMNMVELSQAAFSLCETLDRMITGQRWSEAPVQVHISAMSRLRQVDGNQEICRAIIDGLRRVAAQTAQY